jgi:Ti-type conjugative transfer relaxase TraA
MLSIGKLKGGGLAARYYEEQVASGREDYYSGQGEARGRWMGRGAQATGRAGELGDGELETLLDGAGLRRTPSDKAVAGFDLTFRAPKSVSVLWALSDDVVALQAREAHDAAVQEAMGYVERQACKARRGRDGVVQVEGGGFVAAAFRHRMSRAEDPLLHTHVVLGNLTQGPDGRWTALDARHLYRHAKAAGYLYQAALREELTERLGVDWTVVDKGTAEIAGVDREVIDHFSRRRQQILASLKERGLTSAKAAQVATLDTRPDKEPDPRPLGRLREEWHARAAELGLDRAELAGLLDREPYKVRHVRVDVEVLTEHDSTFGRPDLIQAAAQAFPAGAPVREVEQYADQLRAQTEVVGVGQRAAQAGAPERRYSTRELLEAERSLLAAADRREETNRVPVGEQHVEAAIEGRPTLGEDQEQMVRRLCASTDPVQVVRAPAGTGKTFALDIAREAWQASDISVLGCALSARAAIELGEQAHIPTSTIARLQKGLREGYGLPQGGVLIVDEAGMVGTRALADLAEHAARADAKLVLVGDDRQLPEIQAGGAFRAVADRVETIELRDVHRQTHEWDRDALTHLRDGDLEQWAQAYVDHDRVVVAERADQLRERLVEDWCQQQRPGEDSLMLALRRSDVAELNQAARHKLRDAGQLHGPDVQHGDRAYAVGDRVLHTRNDRLSGAINGQRGTVTEAHPGYLRVVNDGLDAREVFVPARDAEEGVDHAYAMTVHRAQGATVDRTHVLADDASHREWAYTALSRHRDTTTLYLTTSTLTSDRDLPPQDVADALAHLMGRSNAKQLALEPDTPAPREDWRGARDLGLIEGPDLDRGMGM